MMNSRGHSSKNLVGFHVYTGYFPGNLHRFSTDSSSHQICISRRISTSKHILSSRANLCKYSIVASVRDGDFSSISNNPSNSDLTFNNKNPSKTSTHSQTSPLIQFLQTLYQFSRPHTMLGSFISVISTSLLAIRSLQSQFNIPIIAADASLVTLLAVTCSLLVNIFIVGLNQLFDIDIDKVNKPALPLASGKWTPQTGWKVIFTSLSLCILLTIISHPFGFVSTPLLLTLLSSTLLGIVYSAPPLRLKRFPLLASLCILSVRGILVNLGFFMHSAITFGSTHFNPMLFLLSSRELWFSVVFFMIFGIVIALLKDVPDVAGDTQYNMRSYAVQLGAKRLFRLSTTLLSLLYLFSGAFFASTASSSSNTKALILALLHVLIGIAVRISSTRITPENSQQVYDYYMRVWILFYGEYILLPFIA
mmetsp:Transcript_1550/g.2778  ORF Transcript_1550/g.2778 Transcript_1550/m.2778 type:complete len:421 (-) Transcript_1550:925-2187(-)